MPSTEIIVKDIKFVTRDSILTTMFKSRQTKALYSLLMSSTVFIYLVVIANYMADPTMFYEDVSFCQRSFGTIHYFFLMWIVLMTTISLILYPAAVMWMQSDFSRTWLQ